jgi:hypothetical protein
MPRQNPTHAETIATMTIERNVTKINFSTSVAFFVFGVRIEVEHGTR